MARLNVYVPDELAEKAREQGLNVSALTRAAITSELSRRATAEWLAEFPPYSAMPTVSHQDVVDALDATRDELGW